MKFIYIETIKGWLVFYNIYFSDFMWSTWFNLTISVFLSIFNAYTSDEGSFLNLTNLTLPKVPVPIKFNKLNFLQKRKYE